jgi:hypothetical protein
MSATQQGWFGASPLFDPRKGITVTEPPGEGPGWWAGAPSALYDRDARRFYLYYRLRKPRQFGRGVACYVAQSRDGVRFDTIWSATQQEFDSPSIEKGYLAKAPDGRWRLYVSFVDGATGKWRIDALDAGSPHGFDPASRRKAFAPDDLGVAGVKDPVVARVGGLYYMLVSYAPNPEAMAPGDAERMHATADVYNTGITKSCTALATSEDGLDFAWRGEVFGPGTGWDAYCGRLGAVLWTPPVFSVFYDGSASVAENYEEKTGLAVSFDLVCYERVSLSGPILTSPHASGSLRYIDAVQFDDVAFCYYEYARPDGSHELRMNRVPLR